MSFLTLLTIMQASLEAGPSDELTPSRLAAFYRAVGGNYDSLFLKSSDHALSFMYQTLGCYHSLQPTASPFETPRVPCLSPVGFARWQTIQLLLCPEENIGFIQRAVQIWNVPMPNGGTYPKYVPSDVFPDRPDPEMEKWHKMVTGKLNQQNYNVRRIKNSPYQSPRIEANDRRDGYFSSNLRVGRPSRPSRSSSRDDDLRQELYRRRSSVPDALSPEERNSHWDPRNKEEARKARSHSAQRSGPNPPSRQRSKTTTLPPDQQKSSDSSTGKRHVTAPPESMAGRRSSGGYNNMAYRSPARTPSTVEEDSGSEASSETSQMDRRHRKSDEDRKSRKTSSLWVPSFLKSSSSHKRRHSSDAGYRSSDRPPPPTKPARQDYYPPPPPRAVKPPPSQPQQPLWRAQNGNGGAPWRDQNWDKGMPKSTPDLAPPGTPLDSRAPQIRYPDQASFEPLTRESSSGSDQRHRSSASDWERGGPRRQIQQPPRVETQTGVSGRKYPTPDMMSPIDRQRTHPPRAIV
jgi:hypothetical protein